MDGIEHDEANARVKGSPAQHTNPTAAQESLKVANELKPKGVPIDCSDKYQSKNQPLTNSDVQSKVMLNDSGDSVEPKMNESNVEEGSDSPVHKHLSLPAASNSHFSLSIWDSQGDEDPDGLSNIPANPNNDAASSVAATVAFSSSSQRSIMSQYSSDLEEEDLMGELVSEQRPSCLKPNAVTTGNTGTSPSATSNPRISKMQQLEHQRRLQIETKKISSRNIHQQSSIAASSQLNSVPASSNAVQLSTTLQNQINQAKYDLGAQNQLNFDKIISILHAESVKRTVMENRFYAQLKAQAESMVAMEMKLLKLEAKVERREKEDRVKQQVLHKNQTHQTLQQQHQHRFPGIDGFPPDTMILGNVKEAMAEDEEEEGDEEDDDSDVVLDTRRQKKILKKIVASSGASLVSAVTAMSGEGFGLEEEEEEGRGGVEDGTDEGEEENVTLGSSIIERTAGTWNRGRGRMRGTRAIVTGIAAEDDGSASTPTQSSHRPTLESILMNPLVLNQQISTLSMNESVANTTRAIRSPPDVNPVGGEDENSTLATSVTSATLTSTVVTGATSLMNANTSRGGSLIPGVIGEHSSYSSWGPEPIRVPLPNDSEDQGGIVEDEEFKDAKDGANVRVVHGKELLHQNTQDLASIRSNSPLTVPSMSGHISVAPSVVSNGAASFGMSTVATNAAVAATRDFRGRRAAAASYLAANAVNESNASIEIPSHVVNSTKIEQEERLTQPRSRSNSPLTVFSTGGNTSIAPSVVSLATNNTLATAITSSAIAASRDFRSRRANAAAQLAASAVNESSAAQKTQQQHPSLQNQSSLPSTPLASATTMLGVGGASAVAGDTPRELTNRVVSFVNSSSSGNANTQHHEYIVSDPMEGAHVVFSGSGGGVLRGGEGDSLTVPEELDNLSDVEAVLGGASARWREDYEARLDDLQKRLSNS